MPRFRKKPIVIEARQLDGGPIDVHALAKWCGGDVSASVTSDRMGLVPTITIHTLEGDHQASPGDWIIKGVAGEFYPCKPDIFELTYEPAEDTESA